MAVQFYGAGQLFPQIPVNVPLSAVGAAGQGLFQPHPAYVFGERVVRPILDLTSQFLGNVADRITTTVGSFFKEQETSSTNHLETPEAFEEKELVAYVTVAGSGSGAKQGGVAIFELKHLTSEEGPYGRAF